jgi:hypothetical protein
MITAHFENKSLTRGWTIGKLNPFGENFERFLRRGPLYPSVIYPFDLEFGVKKMIRKVTIVCENNKPRRVPVESTNWKIGAIVLGHIIGNRATPLRV